MYKNITVKDMVRVPPEEFSRDIEEAVISSIKKKYEGFISRDIGIVIDVIEVYDMGEGIVVPGDGAAYYQLQFSLLTYKPEVGEVVYCSIKDIADFGAFLDLGSIDGMIHISQTMDDFVSFSSEKVLSGKATKKVLKIGDLCRARIVAISYKDITNPRIGLTMRQPGLGKTEWIEEDLKEKPKKTVKKQ
ncbi:MAG: DNA-directed RNA polymerase [Candidatus Woesearchaeota archaeon]